MTFYESSTYLLYTGNVSCDVLHCHWVFHSQAMALAFDPRLVDQYPPIRGQARPVLPDVILLTDDSANRQKAEKEGIKALSGMSLAFQLHICVEVTSYLAVRRYVEGAKDSSQLLDLLSATGSDELEPTKAVSARQALYPEVRQTWTHT